MTTDKIIIYVFAVIIYILIAINFWLNHKWSQSEKRVNKLNYELSELWTELGMYRRIARKQTLTPNFVEKTNGRWKPNSRKDNTNDKN